MLSRHGSLPLPSALPGADAQADSAVAKVTANASMRVMLMRRVHRRTREWRDPTICANVLRTCARREAGDPSSPEAP